MGAKPRIDSRSAGRASAAATIWRLPRAPRAPLDVARGMVALHATDPATVYLSQSPRASTTRRSPTIEAALYDDRVLLRMLGMRRTMFVVPVDFAPVVQAACTRAIAAQERRRTHPVVRPGRHRRRRRRLAGGGRRADRSRRSASAAKPPLRSLAADVPELKQAGAAGRGQELRRRCRASSTRILMQLSADGRIVRGRPRGSWISSQYRWSPMDAWLPGGLPELSPAAAQVELIRRWLRSFGPGTLADLKWWTGLTLGEVRRALQALEAVEVDLGEASGWVLADDLEPEPTCEPWVALLPALDPTPMGFVERTWFLGAHAPRLSTARATSGRASGATAASSAAGPSARTARIAYKLLEDVGAEAERAVESAAHDLAGWLGAGARHAPLSHPSRTRAVRLSRYAPPPPAARGRRAAGAGRGLVLSIAGTLLIAIDDRQQPSDVDRRAGRQCARPTAARRSAARAGLCQPAAGVERAGPHPRPGDHLAGAVPGWRLGARAAAGGRDRARRPAARKHDRRGPPRRRHPGRVAASIRRCWSPTRSIRGGPACCSGPRSPAAASRPLDASADTLDLAHWWAHPLTARRVAEEWTKLACYLVQGAYW